MKNIFWNVEEKRLRAFWRLLVYLLLTGILMIVFSFVAQLAVIAISVATHQLDLSIPGDPAQLEQAILSLPLTRLSGALATLAAMLGAAYLAGRFLDRRKFTAFGFHFNRRWWADLAFGLFLGAVLMAFVFLVEWAAGWLRIEGTLVNRLSNASFAAWIGTNAIVFLCVGIYEELFSRGYLLRNLAEGFKFGPIRPRAALLVAYLISSSIFGFLHLGNPNTTPISTLNLVLAGLFLGLGYVLTGDLAISIGLHITWNFFQGPVFGFPVSGGAPLASFIGIQQMGPEWMTGGAFGPEAGVVGLAAMALGSVLILLWVRRTRGAAAFREDLAVYTPVRPPEAGFSAALPVEQPSATD